MRLNPFWRRAAILAAGALASSAALAGDFGELLNGPGSGHVNLHPSRDVWIGVAGVPNVALPRGKNAIRFAVIDSGVLLDHPQLRGLIVATRDFSGEGISDRDGHGTVDAIIATMAQALVEPEKKESDFEFLIAKVTRTKDGKTAPMRSAVIAAIKWAAENKAKVVNLSLGFQDDEANNAELCKTIADLKDISFFAAAGNSGPQIREFPAACESPNMTSVAVSAPWSGYGQVVMPGNGNIGLTRLK